MTEVEWQVYRCVIEIRDAGLALRAYATPAAVRTAQQFVTDRQIAPADSAAATTACLLEIARRAKLYNKPASTTTAAEIIGPDCSNLHAEVDYLTKVARFHAASFPREFAASYPANMT